MSMISFLLQIKAMFQLLFRFPLLDCKKEAAVRTGFANTMKYNVKRIVGQKIYFCHKNAETIFCKFKA